jgi:cysteine desulfurase
MPTAPIYLDYHAATPIDPQVRDAMMAHLEREWGNPGSQHALGRTSAQAVERAREHVAALIGAHPKEIVFTSGATEADNLAILGTLRRSSSAGHVLSSMIEHEAILAACHQAQREGHRATLLRPQKDGRICASDVAAALRDDTAIASFMLGNNEIGTINPIAEIAEVMCDHNGLLHCDATQGIGYVPLDVRETAIDLMSFSAHKICGPKGIGALYVRKDVAERLAPLIHGGGQEQGLRAGTLNVPAIVGFGEACRIMKQDGPQEAFRVEQLRDALWATLHRELAYVDVNGSLEHRLPGNLNVAFGFVDARHLVDALDGRVYVSLGSACTATSLDVSHVLRGIGIGNDRARRSVRFGLGRFTSAGQVMRTAEIVIDAVRALRHSSPLWNALSVA